MDEGSNHGAKPLFSSGASNVNGSAGANVTADQTNVTSPTAHFENLSFQTQQSPETTLSFAGISKTGFKITHQQQQEQGTTQQQTQEFKPVILQQQTQQLQPQQTTPTKKETITPTLHIVRSDPQRDQHCVQKSSKSVQK